ncbi:hypothetical protein [Niabella hibiscisoli]|uniref:hypothetical protein n=1 Tax=Niabella hibiscisoli TaxID=1825928 RepID=UPI001F0F301B|nr:hypothetical protein [Niabella hibiscisoli]MCH5716750.1 hypothetical protein [Niabella hibiscisoli]
MLEKKNIIQDQQTAVIVGVVQKDQTEQQVKDYLDELEFLAETAALLHVNALCRSCNTLIPGLLWEKVSWKKYGSTYLLMASTWSSLMMS